MAKILVADDEPMMVSNLLAGLQKEGHDVTYIKRGGEVLDAIAAAAPPFDALLLDNNMPGKTGAAIVAELQKKQEALPPILFISNDGRSKIQDDIRNAGGNPDAIALSAYVGKANTKSILVRLSEALSRSGPDTENSLTRR